MANTPDDPEPERSDRLLRYLVGPRYLAGPADQPKQPLAPLLEAGWTAVSDIALDGLTLLSPDLNTLLRYRPDDRLFPAWTVYAYAPDTQGAVWTATFTWDTPPEIIAGFTTALAHAGNAPAPETDADPFAAFGRAGWARHHGTVGTLYTDPGYLADAHRRHRVDGEQELAHLDETWLLTSTGAHGPWFATASQATPTPLLAALARATLDPRPVIRTSLTGIAREAQITALPSRPQPPRPAATQAHPMTRARHTRRR